jgi:hypothetical protein
MYHNMSKEAELPSPLLVAWHQVTTDQQEPVMLETLAYVAICHRAIFATGELSGKCCLS